MRCVACLWIPRAPKATQEEGGERQETYQKRVETCGVGLESSEGIAVGLGARAW